MRFNRQSQTAITDVCFCPAINPMHGAGLVVCRALQCRYRRNDPHLAWRVWEACRTPSSVTTSTSPSAKSKEVLDALTSNSAAKLCIELVEDNDLVNEGPVGEFTPVT